MLEIDGHGRPATAANVGRGAGELEAQAGKSGPVDPDEIGAHVGKQRAAQWRWSYAGDLDDLNAGQGSGTLRDAHDPAPSLVRVQLPAPVAVEMPASANLRAATNRLPIPEKIKQG